MKVSLYSSKWIYYAQQCWAVIVVFLVVVFIKNTLWSLWFAIPVSLAGGVLFAWIGITILTMFDKNHRIAAKYGIRIENLPIYQEAFNRLIEAESRGENTSWIGDSLPDEQEWLRYLQYEISNGLSEMSNLNEDYKEP